VIRLPFDPVGTIAQPERLEGGSSFWDLVERAAVAWPDAVLAVDEHDRQLTFAEYASRAERVAAGLHVHGVRPGDVVSWMLPTWIETALLIAALDRLGAVQNPMLPIYREREVGFITKQAGTTLMITPSVWRGYDYAALATPTRRSCPRSWPTPSASRGCSTRRARLPTQRA
jgi:cyclohexanecarboxylate-CoA ligase